MSKTQPFISIDNYDAILGFGEFEICISSILVST